MNKDKLLQKLVGRYIQVPPGQWHQVREFQGTMGKFSGFISSHGNVVNLTFEDEGRLQWYYDHSMENSHAQISK